MSYHQRPHELRLAISFEAEALMSSFGDEAYGEARRRAEEASNLSRERLERSRAHGHPQDGEAFFVARADFSLV